MGEALNVALSARSRACCSLLLAIVAIGVVLFGAIYVAPEAAKIKTTAAEVESRAIQLKADHSHLSARLETLCDAMQDVSSAKLYIHTHAHATQNCTLARPL